MLRLLTSCEARPPPTQGGSPDQRQLGQELQQECTVEDQRGEISEIHTYTRVKKKNVERRAMLFCDQCLGLHANF